MSLRVPQITSRPFRLLFLTLKNAASTLTLSLDPTITLAQLQAHKWTPKSIALTAMNTILAIFWIIIMGSPGFPIKLLIPILYFIGIALPITSQILLPASPVLIWLLTFYSARFIPASKRPPISVSVLPTLESVLYGTNISDILTRFTHPVLDIIAWLPYGVIHFVSPVVLVIFLWLFRQKIALKFWVTAFGYMNLTGVLTQIIFPCAPPWYELIYGLTPANYSMPGSPGGLWRIDAIFHSTTYRDTFSGAPVPFGAFPSLHAGWSTLEALFISHFFPQHRKKIWVYVATLYWSTMYLTHHYLIDVVGGACLAVAFFFVLMPYEVRNGGATERSPWYTSARQSLGMSARSGRAKYDQYEQEQRANGRTFRPSLSTSSSRSSLDATLPLASIRSPNPENIPSQQSPQPQSAVPQKFRTKQNSHRHTASIASLIRADERVEDGWSSPVTDKFPHHAEYAV